MEFIYTSYLTIIHSLRIFHRFHSSAHAQHRSLGFLKIIKSMELSNHNEKKIKNETMLKVDKNTKRLRKK